MRTLTTDAVTSLRMPDDPTYAPFLAGVAAGFARRTSDAPALFAVATDGLWDTYLDALTPAERPTYICQACRHFIERAGGFVLIGVDGALTSAVWEPGDVPAGFASVAAALATAVERRPVVEVVRATAPTYGVPRTGVWSHLSVALPPALLYRGALRSASQDAADVRERVAIVERALVEFSADLLADALRVLEADALSRSERFAGPVRWLRDLHVARAATRDERRRSALLWRAVATAPEGYAHPRASVVGTLLEDILAGLPFDQIARRWAEKTHPLQYQRPQAAPAAGNIAEAERIVAQLGLAPAFLRRFARLDDCQTLWTPRSPTRPVPEGGLFAGVVAKDAAPTHHLGVQLPAQTMTWDKFARTVLPLAGRIELQVPSGRGAFIALTAAAEPDAPPLIRWDQAGARNTVSWYVYSGGSPASQWGLTAGAWTPVTAVVPLPNLWGDRPTPHHGEGVVLTLAGAVDTRADSLALFPEHVRDDLRAVRSTVEAFSARGALSGREAASACGYDLRKGSTATCTVRVTTNGHQTTYRIDRWD